MQIQYELAWITTRKGLQMHRTQRTPIKLECISVSDSTGDEEKVGYIMLSLRTAKRSMGQASSVPPDWHPLLSSKYSKMRPEIRLALEIEAPVTDSGLPQLASPARRQPAPAAVPPDPASVTAALPMVLPNSRTTGDGVSGDDSVAESVHREQGHTGAVDATVVVGDANDNEKYRLTVDLVSAKGLQALAAEAASDDNIDSGNQQYYFYYTFLGEDFTLPTLSELENNMELHQQSTIDLSGGWDSVQEALLALKQLRLFLLSRDELLVGTAVVPVDVLVVESAPLSHPITSEYLLVPPGSQTFANEPTPSLTVSIGLSHQGVETGEDLDNMVERLLALQKYDMPRASDSDNSTAITIEADGSDIYSRQTNAQDAPQLAMGTVGPHLKRPLEMEESSSVSSAQLPVGSSFPNLTRVTDIEEARMLCCTVDVRSIRGLSVGPTLARVRVKYTYPFFGSASPVLTKPIEVGRGSEKQFEGSFCSFEFTSTWSELLEQFQKAPLALELSLSDRYVKNDRIGTALIPLRELVNGEPIAKKGDSPIYILDRYIPVRSSDASTHNKVAELRVIVTFADRGVSEQRPSYSDPLHTLSSDPAMGQRGVIPDLPPLGGLERETATSAPAGVEYDAAMAAAAAASSELEAWKQNEMREFRATLQSREAELLKVLADEWKSRDQERETLIAQRADEYTKLERQLRQAIKGLGARESALRMKEQEVDRMKDELHRQYEMKLEDARDASRRLRTDVEHEIDLHKRRVTDLEGLLAQAQRDRDGAGEQYRKLEAEFLEFRQHVASTPVSRLQEEAARARSEVLELQRQLDSAERAKDRYKAQWARALAEIASLKRKRQLDSKEALRREQKELRHMRMKHLMREEQELGARERDELAAIREELQRLRFGAVGQSTASSVGAVPKDASSNTASAPPGVIGGNAPATAEGGALLRVVSERNSLLQSGAYRKGDRIIRELDNRINELIAT